MDVEESVLESGMEKLSDLFSWGDDNGTTTTSTVNPGHIHTTENPLFRDTFFHPDLIEDTAACKAILHIEIGGSMIRLWDVLILIPNLVFIFFLFFRLSSTRQVQKSRFKCYYDNLCRLRLRASKSNVLRMIYSMVVSMALVSALRCFLSILLYLWHPEHYIADTLVWSCGHLILLTIELTIGVLVMTGAKLDTVTHCRTVVVGTGLVSVIVTSVQLYYELTQPYFGYQVANEKYFE